MLLLAVAALLNPHLQARKVVRDRRIDLQSAGKRFAMPIVLASPATMAARYGGLAAYPLATFPEC